MAVVASPLLQRTAALDLAGSDETGMWMLKSPFPNDAPAVTAAFYRAARTPLAAVAARGQRDFARRLRVGRLAKDKRLVAYPFGMAEAMVLEACSSRWRLKYPELLALGPLFDDAEERCAL